MTTTQYLKLEKRIPTGERVRISPPHIVELLTNAQAQYDALAELMPDADRRAHEESLRTEFKGQQTR